MEILLFLFSVAKEYSAGC